MSIVTTGEQTSFEFVEYMVSHGNNYVKVVVVYRTPYSRSHHVTVTTFLSKFADCLESIVLSPEPLLVTGDINIHVDDMNDTGAVKFLDLLESMGMTQHENTPTHRAGHPLHLMITREFDCMIHSEPSSDIFYSDHCMVLAELSLHKPALTVREVSCRKMKAIDRELFRASRLCGDPPESITDLVSCYNTTLSDLLDKHAPLFKKTITVRPSVPWFNVAVKEAKRISRKPERIWRKTRSELDRKRFTKSRNHANHVMEQARRDYYFKFIEENSTDPRRLFKATSALLGNSSWERYPPYKDLSGLANDFGKFFAQKIDNIRFKLDNFEV